MLNPLADGQTMPFTTVKTLLAEAGALLDKSGLRRTDELIDICGIGLEYLARESNAYCATIRFCSALAPHFESELISLIGTLKPKRENAAESLSLCDDVQASAFALVEDMALFMREKKLRDGGGLQSTAEERILSYFENCGNWFADSGEIVTDTYYKLLPIAVVHDMTEMPYEKRINY